MHFKSLRSVFFVVSFFSFTVNAQRGGIWADSPVGKCFESLDKFMNDKFSTGYRDDENLEIKKFMNKKINDDYFWVLDKTPGTNITRFLFSRKENEKICAIMYAPSASSIKSEIKEDGGLPSKFIAIDSPPPNFPITEITYRLENNNNYSIYSCVHIKNNKRKIFSCDKAFLD